MNTPNLPDSAQACIYCGKRTRNRYSGFVVCEACEQQNAVIKAHNALASRVAELEAALKSTSGGIDGELCWCAVGRQGYAHSRKCQYLRGLLGGAK